MQRDLTPPVSPLYRTARLFFAGCVSGGLVATEFAIARDLGVPIRPEPLLASLLSPPLPPASRLVGFAVFVAFAGPPGDRLRVQVDRPRNPHPHRRDAAGADPDAGDAERAHRAPAQDLQRIKPLLTVISALPLIPSGWRATGMPLPATDPWCAMHLAARLHSRLRVRIRILLPLLFWLGACGEREPDAAPPAAAVSATTTQADALAGAHAIDLVGAHLTRNNTYSGVPATCLNLAARGQRNRGWVIEAFDGCSLTERKTHRSLGSWHIDSVTKQIRRLE